MPPLRASWAKADDYAIRSMAQTRATSKALRMPLGFVMELAGFDATPADEIPTEPPRRAEAARRAAPRRRQAARRAAGGARRGAPRARARRPRHRLGRTRREITGAPWDGVTKTIADGVIRQLDEHVVDKADAA